ncbi:hypothetical protein IAR55_000673 [Kwoniella newhampshirensis]|uniref:Uncharacterized protein n=1 Tax=Kwoniella newhampshirensis TaxID=1651941 RepID=A0AAW0Z7E9_9TREE
MRYILSLIPFLLFSAPELTATALLTAPPSSRQTHKALSSDRFAPKPSKIGPVHTTTQPDRVQSAPKPTQRIKQTTRAEIVRRQIRKRHLPLRRAIPSPTPPPPHITATNSETWDLNHVGIHFLLSDDNRNPVNDYPIYPPVMTSYPRSIPQNDALVQCASYALEQVIPYWALQMWYSDSRDVWICQAFVRYLYADRSEDTDWSVENADANPVFGYEYFSENPV